MIYTLVRKNSDGNVDSVISFDSIMSMEEEWSAKVSSQTVEKGFDISDNINIEPTMYNISGSISSYSLFNLDSEIVWDGTDFAKVGNSNSPTHVEARDEIIRVFKERSILTLIESSNNSSNPNMTTKVEELLSGYNKETDNCVMTSLSISHPDSGGGLFYVTIRLQKILVAVVSVENLAENEMSPAVTPMKNTTDAVSSDKETSEEDGDTTDMNGQGVLKTDEQLEADAANEFVVAGRDTQAQGEVKAQKRRLVFKDQIAAREQALADSAIDGYGRDVKLEGDGWKIYIRK